jgi:hypothetical protein
MTKRNENGVKRLCGARVPASGTAAAFYEGQETEEFQRKYVLWKLLNEITKSTAFQETSRCKGVVLLLLLQTVL